MVVICATIDISLVIPENVGILCRKGLMGGNSDVFPLKGPNCHILSELIDLMVEDTTIKNEIL